MRESGDDLLFPRAMLRSVEQGKAAPSEDLLDVGGHRPGPFHPGGIDPGGRGGGARDHDCVLAEQVGAEDRAVRPYPLFHESKTVFEEGQRLAEPWQAAASGGKGSTTGVHGTSS